MTATEYSAQVSVRFSSFVNEIVAGLLHLRIHSGDHPQVNNAARRARAKLTALLQQLEIDSIQVMVSGDTVRLQDMPMVSAALSGHLLIKSLIRWNVGGLEFSSGTQQRDIRTLFEMLRRKPQGEIDHRGANQKLQQAQCRGIRCVPHPFHGARVESWIQELESQIRTYQAVVSVVQDISVVAGRGAKIRFEPLATQVQALLDDLDNDNGPLLTLGRCNHPDVFFAIHAIRTTLLTLHLTRELTQDRELLCRVGVAAMLYDIGLARLPYDISHSEMVLTEDERVEMGHHPELGTRFLLEQEDTDPLAIAAAFGHHKSESGKGYPETKHIHELSLVTEIVKICDVFEGLTGTRPYRPAMLPPRAYRLMISMRNHFQLPLLRRFIEVNGFFPCGQLLRNSEGEIARVVRQTHDPAAPVIRVLRDASGNALQRMDQMVVDLSKAEKKGVWGPLEEQVDDFLVRA